MSWKDIFKMSGQIRTFDRVLADQAHCAVQMVALLQKYIECTEEGERMHIAQEASDLEHDGDRSRSIIVEQLYQTFVTPFDREDINDLSEGLDDIVDYAENTIKEIALYRVDITGDLQRMIPVLAEGTQALAHAVELLPTSLHTAGDKAVAAKRCENQMEDIYRHAIADLTQEDDLHILIKMREIYRHLSNAADRLDLVANILIRIAIKQGH